MRFGPITNQKTHKTMDIIVGWKNVSSKTKLKLYLSGVLVGILLEKVVEIAFEAGAEAYDNSQDHTFRVLELIVDDESH